MGCPNPHCSIQPSGVRKIPTTRYKRTSDLWPLSTGFGLVLIASVWRKFEVLLRSFWPAVNIPLTCIWPVSRGFAFPLTCMVMQTPSDMNKSLSMQTLTPLLLWQVFGQHLLHGCRKIVISPVYAYTGLPYTIHGSWMEFWGEQKNRYSMCCWWRGHQSHQFAKYIFSFALSRNTSPIP